MSKIETPSNWDKMDYGEKLIWLLEKQQEIRKEMDDAFSKTA